MIDTDTLEILGIPKWLKSHGEKMQKIAVEKPPTTLLNTHSHAESGNEKSLKKIKCLVVEKQNNQSFLLEGVTKELLFKMLNAIKLSAETVVCISVRDEADLNEQLKNFEADNILLMGDFKTVSNNVFVTHHPSEILVKPELKRIVWETLKKIKNV